ncbi:MAG: ADOP family duplicated permease [Candidatus Sulfopaludibacter sp.]|nr:ADOP family duplicated permease [Candidatus Sulfopaludibacter sp.]
MSLWLDIVFAWRQINKSWATSAAAILSLGLAMGACTSAFRLIDALLLRPLPVAHPERLYALSRLAFPVAGQIETYDRWEYPLFQAMREAVRGQAELMAVSGQWMDVSYGPDRELEKARGEYVSGWIFGALGLRPEAGRLLNGDDDLHPRQHAVAVLSYDYWMRRFGGDAKAVGGTFRFDNDLYDIVGVAPKRFTGTEPGTMTDIFLPAMMNSFVENGGAAVFRIYVRLNAGSGAEPVRGRLQAVTAARDLARHDRVKVLAMESAAAGVSSLQKQYRRSLAALAVLVALVLLIACANVANLMTAQAAARSREMAVRVSIGAGRWRLARLVLVEGAMLAMLAAAVGALFAAWSAPWVVSTINPPYNPARLEIPVDWQVLAFGLALTLSVTLLFGLTPALRVSAVQPASVLRGGEDPHSRRRLMHLLIAVQAAFCFLVLFVGGLFVATFERLANQPTGFSAERLVTLETLPERPVPPVFWDQAAERLRAVPGVEKVALSQWALLDGWGFAMSGVAIPGAPKSDADCWFLDVSPGWLDVMKIPLLAGRDFRSDATTPGEAIVNQAFARQFFGGENPVGKSFAGTGGWLKGLPFQIVGLAGDARYRDMRETIWPTAYVPFRRLDDKGGLLARNRGTFIVRTTGANPLSLAAVLRREVARVPGSGFHVSNVRTQADLDAQHTLRERLLAKLGLFFAAVALLLAGVGLYGVLNYSVLQRRREIGIRMALGAPAGDIARRVTVEAFAMVLTGALAGSGAGMFVARYLESLLYQVKATDAGMLALPALAIAAAALTAAVPAVIRAVRIDPVTVMRAE